MQANIDNKSKSSLTKLSRTTMSLSQLKKRTQNHAIMQNKMQASSVAVTQRQIQSRGRLRLGAVAKPSFIISKEERKDPFLKGNSVISEQLLNKKGVIGLITMGTIKKNSDYRQLLNNKYELVEKQAQILPTFMTNPAIYINTYYEINKEKQADVPTNRPINSQLQIVKQYQKPPKAEQSEKRVKIRSSKKKVIKKQESGLVIPQQKVKLNVVNGCFQKNQDYCEFVKKLKRNGMNILFSIYAQKIKKFADKYSLKKFTITPELNQTKKITTRHLLQSIHNAKVIGIHAKLKGTPLAIFANLLVMKVAKIRYKKLQSAIIRLQKFKGKFRIKKFFREMLDRRWGYLTFKLAAFAESQRRAMELSEARPEVQVHLITSDIKPNEQKTFYKCRQRRMSHLMRLYNNEADHIVLIVPNYMDLSEFIEEVQEMASTWKKPQIHVIHSNLGGYSLQETANIYFGLTSESIARIKTICKQKKTFLIPYRISHYLPQITEILGLTLFAGSFREQSKSILFEEDNELPQKKQATISKFTNIKVNSNDIVRIYKEKLKRVELSNRFFQSKEKVKSLFLTLKLRSPQSLSLAGMNQREFLKQFVKLIVKQKEQSTWVLKLPNSTFSRGLAFFQTDSLKIIKDNKKKSVVKPQDIEQISKIIEAMLVQKMMIPHNSLITGEQFLANFKEMGGYVEAFLQNAQSVCVFGRIQLNGLFTLLGSYKRYYAENICFGAMYPGLDISQELLNEIRRLCSSLYKQNLFGYITFELLIDTKTKQVYFLDLVPHLQVFSELYFYYKRLLNINQIDFTVALTRKIFYVPFIDNNGNKTTTWGEFQDELIQHKITFNQKQIIGTKFLSLSTAADSEGFPPESTPKNLKKVDSRFEQPASKKKSSKRADVLSMICVQKQQAALLRQCLESLNFLVSIGGQFNKFDKKSHSSQSDGLYLLDIIWRMRQLKRETA